MCLRVQGKELVVPGAVSITSRTSALPSRLCPSFERVRGREVPRPTLRLLTTPEETGASLPPSPPPPSSGVLRFAALAIRSSYDSQHQRFVSPTIRSTSDS
ncbi:hypothetical protein E2C01_065492 [Portunus trituberculatus]|uniref:Uncharacterized protein n=1 Tax=Portunus trituberculatus TaxID=210409 RepID=A0A5B7HFQ7_PORTR|nr:hypothetical protein [Portunus trituberculatus]